jgi:DTW domain-containing protein YfiP
MNTLEYSDTSYSEYIGTYLLVDYVTSSPSSSMTLSSYLENFSSPASLEQQEKWGRVECCHSSRSLYCSDCFRLLMPSSDWPEALHTTKLPFNLHIILHDKRKAATGIHAVVLDQASPYANQVTMVDIERDEVIPDYSTARQTYLLFPSEDSIPLSSVKDDISTLVVLDCKWTRTSSREHPGIASLPKVHLSRPPTNSNYWRWHSAGPGMLCTIEAIYEAATELAAANNYLHLLWLFGLQRSYISRAMIKSGDALPFTHHSKVDQQKLRRTKGTEKQVKDKEKGKILKSEVKRERGLGNELQEARKPRWRRIDVSSETKDQSCVPKDAGISKNG